MACGCGPVTQFQGGVTPLPLRPPTEKFEGQAKMQDLQVSPGGRLEARCNECSLRLRGDFQELVLDGKDNFVEIEGRARVIRLAGQHNRVECQDGPEQVFLSGSGQRVKITEQPGRARPQVQVEGTDQGVTYRPASQAEGR